MTMREEKLLLLGEGARFDIHCAKAGKWWKRPRKRLGGIYNAVARGGVVPIFKVLLTNVCTSDCAYCPNRADSPIRRVSFSPEELAATFDELYRRGLARGIFLSSGLGEDPRRTMEQMIATIEIIRKKYGFKGYVHLKILPGATEDLVERAVQLADRVSINLEAPNPERLSILSSKKALFGQILAAMDWIRKASERHPLRSGFTTQFVVGPAGESDRELLETTEDLIRRFGIRRAYFSGFEPVPLTPLEDAPPESPLREYRLYQAEFLLREYGFSVSDLPFDERGMLPEDIDPKMAFALGHPELYPVELTTASYEELLKVPGIGPRSARAILEMRRKGELRDERDLRRAGVRLSRASPFVTLRGRRLGELPQLALAL